MALKVKSRAGDDVEMGDDEDDDAEDAGEGAKREALAALAKALGVSVKDEGAALEAFSQLVYHCGGEG